MQELILKNLITIIFILLITYGFITGFVAGFLKKILSFGSITVTIIVTRYFTPMVSSFVKDVTNIESTLTASIYDYIIKNHFYDQISVSWLDGSIDTGSIQESIRSGLCTNIANVVINLACGIVMFIIVLILTKIVLRVLDIVDFIPVIGQLNKILGGAFGVFEMILIMWIVFTIFRSLENVPQIKVLTDNIKGAVLVGYFYNHNFIFNFFDSLFSAFSASGKVM